MKWKKHKVYLQVQKFTGSQLLTSSKLHAKVQDHKSYQDVKLTNQKVNKLLGKRFNQICDLVNHESANSSVVMASDRCMDCHGFDSRRKLRFFVSHECEH